MVDEGLGDLSNLLSVVGGLCWRCSIYRWSHQRKSLHELNVLRHSDTRVQVQEDFGISETAATLGLTVYVAGNGVGVMFWSPVTELPQVGRSSIYIATLFAFVLLQIPTALASNLGMLLTFRFISGFVGSPSLAAGGASLGDMYSPAEKAFAISWWDIAALCGPALGPLIGGFVAQTKGWRWTIWMHMWLATGTLIALLCFLPETSAANILYRRARRLRRLSGNDAFRCQAELDYAEMSRKDIALDTLVRPFTLNCEPILLSLNLYVSLIYALQYTWLESFPIVFQDTYQMSLGEEGLTFLSIGVGALITTVPFFWYLRRFLKPCFDEDGKINPELRMNAAMVGSFLIPTVSDLVF